jgi:hypothetical protein
MSSYHTNIDRKSGDLRIVTFGGGHPRRFQISLERHPEAALINLETEDLHDLRHLIERTLAQLAD